MFWSTFCSIKKTSFKYLYRIFFTPSNFRKTSISAVCYVSSTKAILYPIYSILYIQRINYTQLLKYMYLLYQPFLMSKDLIYLHIYYTYSRAPWYRNNIINFAPKTISKLFNFSLLRIIGLFILSFSIQMKLKSHCQCWRTVCICANSKHYP